MPSRALTTDEILANLVHFTTGRDTPRTRPCTRLALSGVHEQDLDPGVVEHARELGVERIVMHGRNPALEGVVDAIALRITAPIRVGSPELPWTAVVPLQPSVVDQLDAIASEIAAARPERVVLAWPFPAADVALPPLDRTIGHANRAIARLMEAGIPASLRGLPPCVDGSDEGRTSNRFYVDADHQLNDALLFVPDIVQFDKPDSCRVCRKSVVCDGVPRDWLDRGVVGPLEPITETR